MEYEDTVRMATPEGVEIEFALAGIGSRLTARLIDLLIKAAIIFTAVLILRAATGDDSLEGTFSAVIGILVVFIVFWAYDVFFEAFNSGRTPGKRALGVRVIGERGEPVGFAMAAVRNILRIVDEYLTLWLGALISIVRSDRNQRMGDMAAGTLVVKDRALATGPEPELAAAAELGPAAAWDTSRIGAGELTAARRFLERRHQLEPHIRRHLADDLARRLRPMVPGNESVRSQERFVEQLVAVRSRRL